MKQNILTHISDTEIKQKLNSVYKEFNLRELEIDDYEQLFQALLHFDPMMLIVEINSTEDPYFAVIRIMKNPP